MYLFIEVVIVYDIISCAIFGHMILFSSKSCCQRDTEGYHTTSPTASKDEGRDMVRVGRVMVV